VSDESADPVGLGGLSLSQGLSEGAAEVEDEDEADESGELPQGLSELGALKFSILLFITATASSTVTLERSLNLVTLIWGCGDQLLSVALFVGISLKLRAIFSAEPPWPGLLSEPGSVELNTSKYKKAKPIPVTKVTIPATYQILLLVFSITTKSLVILIFFYFFNFSFRIRMGWTRFFIFFYIFFS
jgi:hypothetical protein